jgi:glycosyltransferase involved in cell wall biosynthesis
MKITHLIFDLNTGGAETMLVDIINEQIKTEEVFLIIINDQIDNNLLAQIDNRVKIILIRRKEMSRNPIPIFKLNWFLMKLNSGIIHCHQESIISLMFLKRDRVVVTIHTTGVKTANLTNYKTVFAISNTVKTDIENRCLVKPILIYNGIRTDEVKLKVDYDYSTFKIVQIGRLDHEIKGQYILLKALKVLNSEFGIRNISVDFIGTGKSLDYLNGLVKEYHLEDYVNFLGMRDRRFIYEHLKDYNLLVQPSLYEGFGLTIVEAMAAKVPVLVSDIDGPLEVIANGLYGRIHKSADSNDCANSIFKIIENYRSIGSIKDIDEAFNYSFRHFDIRETAANYLKYY